MNPTSGRRVVAFEIDEKVRENLINGWDDIALTESYRDRIAAFRSKDRTTRPWAIPATNA